MKGGRDKGFTLIELLAAMSVLLILVVIFSQVIALVSGTWKSGKARVDNFTQARTALGLIERDVQAAILRRDLAAFVGDSPTGRACAFYTQIPGSGAARRISLVQYRVADPTVTPRLVRSEYAMDYDSGTKNLSFDNIATLPDLPLATSQDLASGVILFEWQFIDAKGLLQDKFSFDQMDPGAQTNTRSLVISLVVLDNEAYKMAMQPGKLGTLLSKLGGTPTANQTFSNHWKNLVEAPDFVNGLPLPIVRSIRVFERSISIPLKPYR